MSVIDAVTVFGVYRERLRELLGDDADISIVERAITSHQLDDDDKCALWLWAIAPFDPATLRRHPHMTTSSDSRHPASRSTRQPGRADGVGNELAKLRGRILGDCAACGRTVYLERNFTRLRGRLLHVRCPITTHPPTTPAARPHDPRTPPNPHAVDHPDVDAAGLVAAAQPVSHTRGPQDAARSLVKLCQGDRTPARSRNAHDRRWSVAWPCAPTKRAR